MRKYVEEPALAARPHSRNAGHRIGEEASVAYDPEPARPLGDEHVPVREPGHSPGMIEPLGHGHDPEVVARGLLHAARRGRTLPGSGQTELPR